MGSSGQDSVLAGKLWGVLNLSLRASGLVHFWLRRHAEHPYDDENDNVRLHGGKVLDWSPVVFQILLGALKRLMTYDNIHPIRQEWIKQAKDKKDKKEKKDEKDEKDERDERDQGDQRDQRDERDETDKKDKEDLLYSQAASTADCPIQPFFIVTSTTIYT